ncbi:uncharacterized protein LOC105702842, partial [Orussus abietinus]|uniref:uncharacterized protein LOC105702842 n=1 Tax=Orussus abietinus TaxID=222816 RepID=UPI000C715AA8
MANFGGVGLRDVFPTYWSFIQQYYGYADSFSRKINLAGSYGCEVSSEGPSFLTTYKEANMSVGVLPKRAPVLEGLRPNYQVGEYLAAECTSAPSHPPAKLAFFLNDKEVSKAQIKVLPTLGLEDKIVASSRLGFSIRLERHHFPGGTLSLICRSTLPGISVAKPLETEVTATLAASNQRLAQVGGSNNLGILLLDSGRPCVSFRAPDSRVN